jgi:hypothetical protein
MHIGLEGAELFHAERGTDGRTDRLIDAFCKFANAPEKRQLGRPGVRDRLVLKYVIKKRVGKV